MNKLQLHKHLSQQFVTYQYLTYNYTLDKIKHTKNKATANNYLLHIIDDRNITVREAK